MKLINKIILSIIILVFYFIAVNVTFSVLDLDIKYQDNNYKEDIPGFVEKVNTDDKVSVMVKRNRWYGTIIENVNPDYTTKTLFLFRNPFGLVLKSKKYNLVYIHLIFIILFLFLLIFLFFFNKNKKKVNYYIKDGILTDL